MVVLRTAWLGDDAFITLRTIDNFHHGFGLRWNIDERVQGYTHPLWMLLLLVTTAITREQIDTTIILSVVVSLTAGAVLVTRFARSSANIVWMVALLCLSRSFQSYSTSGLENPLTHLLLALYLWIYLREPASRRRLVYLSSLAGLAMLNRMDSILLFGPALVASALELRRAGETALLRTLVCGFIPMVLWELFSLFYYGVPFPNTAYAKLSLGVPPLLLARQGLFYFENLAVWDPLTALTLALALATSIRRPKSWPIAAGIALYLLYVLRIGGDFMAGRFFAAPFVASVVLLGELDLTVTTGRLLFSLPLLGIFSAGGLPFKWMRGQGSLYSKDGVTDERVFYYRTTGLFSSLKPKRLEDSYLPNFGLNVHKHGFKIKLEAAIGQVAYYAGPTVHFVDVYGLTEPLLARLPVVDPLHSRIGHFQREIPDGYYQDSVVLRPLQLHDPDLIAYRDKLMVLIQADLLASGRLREIWRWNIGTYDEWLQSYIARPHATWTPP